ncbi:hypothetical protein EJ08DRAFT_462580 [Tothia fuscella]|uniref:Uncharacterized protein n=1 Tax=Tothia fuscella TaxID=1048955 RepID=A0A9P4NIX1_9PEZI|nr:hypothetical protein EJ08DRAFT_462580 [Tothia fuscella]
MAHRGSKNVRKNLKPKLVMTFAFLGQQMLGGSLVETAWPLSLIHHRTTDFAPSTDSPCRRTVKVCRSLQVKSGIGNDCGKRCQAGSQVFFAISWWLGVSSFEVRCGALDNEGSDRSTYSSSLAMLYNCMIQCY